MTLNELMRISDWDQVESITLTRDTLRALLSRLEAAERVCTRVESEGGHGYLVHERVQVWRAIRDAKEGT